MTFIDPSAPSTSVDERLQIMTAATPATMINTAIMATISFFLFMVDCFVIIDITNYQDKS
jgi:hypothetical protein